MLLSITQMDFSLREHMSELETVQNGLQRSLLVLDGGQKAEGSVSGKGGFWGGQAGLLWVQVTVQPSPTTLYCGAL